MADVVVEAENAGLDELWLGDEGPARDPLVTLAAAAPRTTRIGLGVAVTNPYLRHPAATASAFGTLAELAPGRVVLGLGAGGGLALGPVGLDRPQPLTRVAEAVRIARAVLCGTSTEGYQVPPHAIRAPDVPIFIGARGERLNRLASDVADGVFLGGVPLPMMATTLGWARSRRPVAAASLSQRGLHHGRGGVDPPQARLRVHGRPPVDVVDARRGPGCRRSGGQGALRGRRRSRP